MSKHTLKKELSSFDREQLIEVILNAYSSSKEAKDYFEFFLNPDAEAFYEKKLEIVTKELNRSKRGHSKARVSVLRSEVKQMLDYGIGAEYAVRLMQQILMAIIRLERYFYLPSALRNGARRFARDIVDLSNKNEMLSFGLDAINEVVEDSTVGRVSFRNEIANAVRDYMQELKI